MVSLCDNLCGGNRAKFGPRGRNQKNGFLFFWFILRGRVKVFGAVIKFPSENRARWTVDVGIPNRRLKSEKIKILQHVSIFLSESSSVWVCGFVCVSRLGFCMVRCQSSV